MMMSIDKIYRIEPVNYTITLRATHKEERFPIAYAAIEIEEEDGIKIGNLRGLLRMSEFKGHGICKDILEKRIEICKALSCDEIRVRVYPERKNLIDFYINYGFQEMEPTSYGYRRFVLHV